MTLSRLLRERREALELTQQQAADRAGITRVMWAKLEAGECGTRRDKIPRIAEAIETDLGEVYAAAGYAADATYAPDAELQRLLKGLTPEQTRIVLSVAKSTREALLTTAA